MREFEAEIDEALTVGLRPDRRMPRNSQVLTECLGFRIGNSGIEGTELLTNPIPAAVDMHYNWPFPQFLVGEEYRILVVRDAVNMEDVVYSLDSDYSIATQIFAIDQLTFGQGTLMEMADFGEYAFMTNGVIMIYWDPTISDWHEVIASATIPMMRTVCNFKGQMVGGCILSSWHDCDETSIVWSKIGQADFTPDQRNEAGYRRDPFGGEVYHVRRLGNSVIVYSSKGITKMIPTSDPATFGFEEIHDKGIINRGAVGGNLKQHCCVDSDGFVQKLNEEGLKNLGYQEYMDNLGEDIIVNYNASRGDFHISDGTTGYLLSPKGMSESPDTPSAVWFDRRLYGLPASTSAHIPLVASDIIDFGYRGQKTIFSLEAGYSEADDAEVAIDWRTTPGTAFQRTEFVPLNNEGIASLIISGIEFRVCIRFSSFAPYVSTLDYIKARWKMTDLRGLRGVYAAPPRGQG